MPDFDSLLGGAVGTAERPKQLPEGPYLLVVKQRKFDVSKEKRTPFVEFEFGISKPLEGVDLDLLGEVKKWQERKPSTTFYLTEDSLFRLDDFLKLFPGLEGMDRRPAIEKLVSEEKEVIGNAVHESFTTRSGKPGIRVNWTFATAE